MLKFRILLSGLVLCTALSADEFASEIRPTLAKNCQACHDPEGDNRIKFLTAQQASDLASDRSLSRAE